MFLQGNLQVVFDTLYQMGIIDPVLKMDWSQALEEVRDNPKLLQKIVATVNSCCGNQNKLSEKLKNFDQRTLSFLAMEVARELASYHTRNILH